MNPPPGSILCPKILGVLPQIPEDDTTIDLLDLTWREMRRHALRAITRGGRSLRILLPADQRLQHGAVLIEEVSNEHSSRIVINLMPCDVFVVRQDSPLELAQLAYAIGNLHLPAQLLPPEILLAADRATEASLANLGLRYERRRQRFTPDEDFLPQLISRLK